MKITEDVIAKVNGECPYDQGIFVQPWGIPDAITEPVVYCRYKTGGMSGGSCWDNSNPQPFIEEPPEDRMEVLDILLMEIAPALSFLQYRKVSKLIKNSKETQWEYYGNCTNYVIEYIRVSELEDLLAEIGV